MAGGRGGGAETAAGALTGDVGFLLARASAVMTARANAALQPFGLRVRLYSVLVLVGDRERPSQRELADGLGLDPSRLVALVDELEQRGLVRREPDPADRRTRLVTATAAGGELVRAAGPLVRAATTSTLAEADHHRLVALLTAVAFPGPHPDGSGSADGSGPDPGP